MNKFHRITGLLLAMCLFAPALAAAQVSMTGSTTIDAQVQSLLSQITALQEQLKTLVQSVAPSTTPPTWGQGWGEGNASSTPPGHDGQQMGDCGSFARNLSVGSRGDDVSQLQQMLQGDGFFSASSTGFFGPLTARALGAFQMHFGIASSSSGFFGPLTRTFLQGHCQGGEMGTSTMGMMGPMRPVGDWQNGSSTPSWGQQGGGPIFHGMMGSSTAPMPPCPNNDNQGAAAALFVPHVILPMMPCGQGQGSGQGSGGQPGQ